MCEDRATQEVMGYGGNHGLGEWHVRGTVVDGCRFYGVCARGVVGRETVGAICVSPKRDSDEMNSVEFMVLRPGVGPRSGAGQPRMTYCFSDGRGADVSKCAEFDDVNIASGERGRDVFSSGGDLDRFQVEWEAAVARYGSGATLRLEVWRLRGRHCFFMLDGFREAWQSMCVRRRGGFRLLVEQVGTDP